MEGTAIDAAWASGADLSLEEAVELGREVLAGWVQVQTNAPSAAD